MRRREGFVGIGALRDAMCYPVVLLLSVYRLGSLGKGPAASRRSRTWCGISAFDFSPAVLLVLCRAAVSNQEPAK